MTDFRTPDQIRDDLRRLNPDFNSVARSNDLLTLLSDRPMAEASASMTGNGPVLFRLGVIDGPEWQGVRDFLASSHVTAAARRDFQGLESDLRAADANGDGYLNNQEIVAFATSHTTRWNTVAAFRSAAEAYLNRLPSYVAQPNLTPDQVSKLYGIMNYYASQWQASGADRSQWGTVMGLSLQDFPSTDTANAPALIQRAARGELTPQEAAAVHRLLAVPRSGTEYDFAAEGSDAPLRPEEIGMLGQILQGANGHSFQGMTILAGDDERAAFGPRNEAAFRFQSDLNAARGGLNVAPPEGGWRAGDQIVINGGAPIDVGASGAAANRAVLLSPDQFNATGVNAVRVVRAGADLRAVSHAVRVDRAALQRTFAHARATFAPFDTDHPERISGSTLLARAYAGDLNPVELGALRVWMRDEAQAQGLTCSGTLDCLRAGAMRFFRNIARDPVHFFARNGALLASSYLYRRFVLRNVVENRLSQLCGGNGVDPSAYRNYEKFVQDQMRSQGFLRSLPRRLAGNPYVALAVFNLGVAPVKDTGNLGVDILTDLPLVPLMFQGLETYDAFRGPMMQRFVDAGSGACRPAAASEPVPAPEIVQATDGAQAASRLGTAELRAFNENDFLTYVEPFADPNAAVVFSRPVPAELQFLFAGSEARTGNWWGQAYSNLDALAATNRLADLMASHYGTDAASQARIRTDMNALIASFPTSDQRSRIPAFRWAMAQYIRGIETGRPVTGEYLASLTYAGASWNDNGGLARVYFGVRESQANQRITFDQALRQYYGEDISLELELEAVTFNTVPPSLSFAMAEFDYRGGRALNEDHEALRRMLPRADRLLIRAYAMDNPGLEATIRADMSTLTTMFSTYGTSERPITTASTNAFKWALQRYITDLSEGRTPDLAALRLQFESPMSPVQLAFAGQEIAAVRREHEEYLRRYNTDPEFRAYQDAMAQYEYEENRRLDPMSQFDNMPIMFLPLPALGAGALLEGVFGAGGAAVETAPAWGRGLVFAH
ncbi:MAG TPA: hypothetical protein VFX30_13520 [bacterium]|nr:hypothetical protein [bacterium]